MITKQVLRTLVYSLAVLLACIVVVSASRSLFAAGGDAFAPIVLHWIGVGLLLLLAADALLLVMVLALRALEEDWPTDQVNEPTDTD